MSCCKHLIELMQLQTQCKTYPAFFYKEMPVKHALANRSKWRFLGGSDTCPNLIKLSFLWILWLQSYSLCFLTICFYWCLGDTRGTSSCWHPPPSCFFKSWSLLQGDTCSASTRSTPPSSGLRVSPKERLCCPRQPCRRGAGRNLSNPRSASSPRSSTTFPAVKIYLFSFFRRVSLSKSKKVLQISLWNMFLRDSGLSLRARCW